MLEVVAGGGYLGSFGTSYGTGRGGRAGPAQA